MRLPCGDDDGFLVIYRPLQLGEHRGRARGKQVVIQVVAGYDPIFDELHFSGARFDPHYPAAELAAVPLEVRYALRLGVIRDRQDRKSTRLNSSHAISRMPSSA